MRKLMLEGLSYPIDGQFGRHLIPEYAFRALLTEKRFSGRIALKIIGLRVSYKGQVRRLYSELQ
jgi:hypothetical protein